MLSHLMKDICELLGIKKLNTTAYYLECDGAVEHFNHALSGSKLQHMDPSGHAWAYRNMPHISTGETPSCLLFGMECHSPTEAALLPPKSPKITNISDCQEEMVSTLSTARALALKSTRSLNDVTNNNMTRKPLL